MHSSMGKVKKYFMVSKATGISFSRQLIWQYKPFIKVTKVSLTYAINKLNLGYDQEKEYALIEAYKNLSYYPEVETLLKQMKHKKLNLVIC